MDDKLNKHISKVQTPNNQVYYIVPEAIKSGSYVINSPTLSADTQFVITSQDQVISGQKDFSTAPRVFVTDHYEPVLTAADVPSSLFMSFNIADATEETVDNIPGYTWSLTEEQFTSLCNPATQSVTVDIVIPGEGDVNQHYIFRRDTAALVGVLGGANFFAVDSSQATTDVIGTVMRLRVYRNVTLLKLRVEGLGELTSNPVKTINSTAPTEGNISLKTINGNEIVGSGNITIADNNQTIKGNGTAFNANDAINIVGSGATTVTADTTNKKITINTPAVTDHNQTIKGNGTAFDADAAINIVGGGATTVAADTTNSKITISTPAVTDTNQKVKAGSVTFDANDTVNFEGSGIVSVTGDATSDKITISASHQSIKTLDTTATTAQATNANEAIVGSGKVTLHKVAKTGTYSDLIGTPSLATVATSGSYNDLSNKPTIPTAVGDLTNDRFVRYDTASQGLSATQKSNARTNIGAGTGNGSVTSVRVQAGTGLSSSQSTAQTGTLNTTISIASGYKLPTSTEWSGKQDKLESGTSIKTINSQTLLGSGNIEINDTGVEVVSTLPTTPEDDTIYFASSNASSTGSVVELPVPTAADAGKIFKINSTGGVELGASSEGKIVYSHNISMTMSPAAGGDHSSASFTLYSTDSTPMTFSTIKSYLSSRGPLYVAGYAIDKNNGLCLCLLLEGFSRGFTLTSWPVSDFTSTKFTSFYDSDEFSNLNDAVKAI